jgi:restriction system protein
MPSQPYWKHRVASALQALKHKSIRQTPNGWLWRGGPSTQPPAYDRPEKRKNEPSPLADENKLSDRLLNTLKELPPKGFQDFVITRLLPSLGLTEISVRQFVKDGGIDGEGLLEISEETIIAGVTEKSSRRVKCGIQVKRWGASISRPDIQTFRGAILGQFERGLYITTSDFSRDALVEARKSGVIPITAIDGAKLSELLIEKGLGVREVTVKVPDPDFFTAYQE